MILNGVEMRSRIENTSAQVVRFCVNKLYISRHTHGYNGDMKSRHINSGDEDDMDISSEYIQNVFLPQSSHFS